MMTQRCKTYLLATVAALTCTHVTAREYVAPPSSSTHRHVPVISDAEMKRCVKIYNEATWIGEELNNSYVDRYNQNSVNAYNQKVAKHSSMIDYFNKNCAGKQSRSAYNAAKQLNQR